MKTKPEVVTYEIVAKKLNELSAAGERISVRVILSHVGGDAGRIAAFLKRWRENQQIMQEYGSDGAGMSEEFKTAYFKEKKLIVKTAIEVKNKELANVTELFNELKDINQELEKKLIVNAEIKQDLTRCQEEVNILTRELQKARNSYDDATTKYGGILQKFEDAKKALDMTKQENKTLAKETRKLSEEKSSWKAKAEQAQEQFKELCKNIKITNK